MRQVTTKDVVVIRKRPKVAPFQEVDLKVDGFCCYATFERDPARGERAMRVKSRYPRSSTIPDYLFQPMREVAAAVLFGGEAKPPKKPLHQLDLFPRK